MRKLVEEIRIKTRILKITKYKNITGPGAEPGSNRRLTYTTSLQRCEVSRAHLPLIIHGSLCILNRSLKNVGQHSSVSAWCNSCRKRHKDRVKTQAMWCFTCSYRRTIRLLMQEEERGGAVCFFFFFFLLFNIFLYTSSPAGFFSISVYLHDIFN